MHGVLIMEKLQKEMNALKYIAPITNQTNQVVELAYIVVNFTLLAKKSNLMLKKL